MDSRLSQVSHIGMDIHKHFSRITAQDATGQVVFRKRLEHADRETLQKQFRSWPAGTPVILEGPTNCWRAGWPRI